VSVSEVAVEMTCWCLQWLRQATQCFVPLWTIFQLAMCIPC